MGWNDDNEQAEDLTEEHRSEVKSLLNRYPKELKNTKRFIESKISSRKKTMQQMTAMQLQLDQLGESVTADYQSTETMLYIILFASLSLIVTINIILLWLKRHLAHVINQTSNYLEKLSSGDLSSSLKLDSKIAEVNQLTIAVAHLKDYFNQLINNINQETATLSSCQKTVISGAQKMEHIISEQQHLSTQSAEQMTQLSQSFHDVALIAAETHTVTTSTQVNIDSGVKKNAKNPKNGKRVINCHG